jgi:hypothetical protein
MLFSKLAPRSRSTTIRDKPEQSRIADQCGLGRTRADDRGKSQTLGADVGLLDAKFSFEHLARPLAERELIDLRFDR